MNLQQAQLALAQLITGGAFSFDSDIATVDFAEYRELIEAMEPAESYSIGYDLAGINYLENCHLDQDERGRTEMIRRERTYRLGPLRAFQLEITTVPEMIIVQAEPEEPKQLSTTWFVTNTGECRAYIQQYNGETITDLRE